MQEAQALPPADSFRALVGVFEGALSDGYEGGMGKQIWQYGWTDKLAKKMLAKLEQVKEVEWAQLRNAVATLKAADKGMSDFGIDEFGSVVDRYDALCASQNASASGRDEPEEPAVREAVVDLS